MVSLGQGGACEWDKQRHDVVRSVGLIVCKASPCQCFLGLGFAVAATAGAAALRRKGNQGGCARRLRNSMT